MMKVTSALVAPSSHVHIMLIIPAISIDLSADSSFCNLHGDGGEVRYDARARDLSISAYVN